MSTPTDTPLSSLAIATSTASGIPLSPKSRAATSALDTANAALAALGLEPKTAYASSGNNSVGSNSAAAARNLELKYNDNAFHVVANLVVDRFQNRIAPGATSLTLTEEDAGYLNQMLQPAVRISLVEAVRFRLQNCCTPDSEANIHVLTRQCRELGLHRTGDNNPLLAQPSPGASTTTIELLPPDASGNTDIATQGSLKPKLNVITEGPPSIPGRPPLSSKTGLLNVEEENQVLRAQLQEQQRQYDIQQRQYDIQLHQQNSNLSADDYSVAASTMTGLSEIQVSNTESVARQQLMTELREASNLMAESVTPEAAKFWRQHVVELQEKLRALHGDSSGRVKGTSPRAGVTVESPPRSPNEDRKGHGDQSESTISRSGYSAPNDIPMVDVVAPANLPGGYHFEAEIESQRFIAAVPAGGVKKGETFSCLMRDLEHVGLETPIGKWRDRLCDCGVFGYFHEVFLNGLFCPLLALGQVMTRSNFDFLGRPIDEKSRRVGATPFTTMSTVVVFWALMNVCLFGAYNFKWSRGMELSFADLASMALVNAGMIVFTIYATIATRGSVREKYVIREKRCYDLEDFCCATFCLPCTVCQLSRHTVDYNNYEATCCTSTGLPDNVDLGAKPKIEYKHPNRAGGQMA